MGAYISMSSEVGGRALMGAWSLKGKNTVLIIKKQGQGTIRVISLCNS